MENCDVVNTIQEISSSSANSDVRNSHSSVCNLNCNRSPSSNPNGVSGYSGNTRSSLMPGSVELLASFMQDIQNIGNADSEIVKNCETRWLQLLRLVEKQCQEQIVAQQEQFHHQIQQRLPLEELSLWYQQRLTNCMKCHTKYKINGYNLLSIVRLH